MKPDQPKAIHLKDYQAPAYLVENIYLTFELGATTTVTSLLNIKAELNTAQQPLVLDGIDLELVSISINQKPLSTNDYTVSDEQLTITKVPDAFSLEIITKIKPDENTSLDGLYQSSGNFCTQCEAEGFRKITYFLDRPDVMTSFTVKVIADKSNYPVLLSNGNLIEEGKLNDGLHFAVWHDPHRKPCYLFALVAGKLKYIEDHFVTQSGKQVLLRVYVEPQNIKKCEHAMQSLIKSMKWDEETFGLEYDLDRYMIVAVDDFNMGAMENKGLNVFNSQYVLAQPDTATDQDYENIEGVIGHEYFHNWTGNRVTCRDWFQLSLKEGLTVFRDQEFSSEMGSRAVKRIDDVKVLRTRQFQEDAGPMAHPIRPESYIEISNFYTVTVYNKGAEVIRMIHTLLGKQGFRRGMDLYFQRHDGQAVTTEDFVSAMADANKVNLDHFQRWYQQAGTPVVDIQNKYDADQKKLTVTLQQSCPPTPKQNKKQPFHIPLAFGLLGKNGQALDIKSKDNQLIQRDGNTILELTKQNQTFEFLEVNEKPVLSVFRGYSAPIQLKHIPSDDDLYLLMEHDSDSFNRWESGQQLAIKTLLKMIQQIKQKQAFEQPDRYIHAVKKILENKSLDKALSAQALILPAESYLAELVDVVEPDIIFEARQAFRKMMANELKSTLMECYQTLNHTTGYQFNATEVARRSLKNSCLMYLMELDDPETHDLCLNQFRHSDNMTDVITALRAFSNQSCASRDVVLGEFYNQWKDEPLVVNKWLSIQATSCLPKTLEEVIQLQKHNAFDIKNPNKVRALIGGFCHGNSVRFHQANGNGYVFLAEQIKTLEKLNPQVAARMLTPLTHWKRYDKTRQQLMKQQLEHILSIKDLSKDVYEIASKSML